MLRPMSLLLLLPFVAPSLFAQAVQYDEYDSTAMILERVQ
jgi:hypothetical protein